jgi:catechol 2,3-dioxygenase-like lactoylglutathione lyase family enzyme
MADFKVLATNHTSFTVSDLDRSIAFFRDCLGFELLSKAPRDPGTVERITGVADADIMVAYVQGPGHRLELIEYLAPADRGRLVPRPCDVGFAHVAFDVDDIEAAITAAARYAVRPLNPPLAIDQGPNAGGKVVYLRDPDGVTIEFIQPPERRRAPA